MTIIAFVTDPAPVHSMLTYLDLPSRPPPLTAAGASRGALDFDQSLPD